MDIWVIHNYVYVKTGEHFMFKITLLWATIWHKQLVTFLQTTQPAPSYSHAPWSNILLVEK